MCSREIECGWNTAQNISFVNIWIFKGVLRWQGYIRWWLSRLSSSFVSCPFSVFCRCTFKFSTMRFLRLLFHDLQSINNGKQISILLFLRTVRKWTASFRISIWNPLTICVLIQFNCRKSTKKWNRYYRMTCSTIFSLVVQVHPSTTYNAAQHVCNLLHKYAQRTEYRLIELWWVLLKNTNKSKNFILSTVLSSHT